MTKLIRVMPGPIVHIEVFNDYLGILYRHPRKWWQFWKEPETLVFKSFRMNELAPSVQDAVEDFKKSG